MVKSKWISNVVASWLRRSRSGTFFGKIGKVSAIIFGATSKKVKSYLQIGNKLYLNHTYKNEGKIGYFKVEILKAYTPEYFDSKKKLMCIASAMNLIKILTVESQENLMIFKLIENFFKTLQSDDWIKE